MVKNLVIVESPAKAKTVGKFLGSGYSVKASMGHVRDLPKSKLGVDTDNDFAPQYLIPRDKSKIVKELKGHVKNARTIYLATDPDREGEAIAWHLVAATNAEDKEVRRIVFHEITRDAIERAVANSRSIDMHLVDAQQARRVLDRLVGYKISPILWRKVKRGLSAGRVQSAALRLVVDREREIERFVAVEYWSIEADLAKQSDTKKRRRKEDVFHAVLQSIDKKKVGLKGGANAQKVVDDLEGADYVVGEVRQKEARRYPSPPFITSTLQQEASRKLNFTAKRTMVVAQQLYEGIDIGAEGHVGLITYMRTDSTQVAAVAQREARELIATKYGAAYLPPKSPFYRTKAKGAQEAHEAIRPTSVFREPEFVQRHLTPEQYRLYRLVWQRFVASQMAAAALENTTVDIRAGRPQTGKMPYLFRASGSVVRFPGFFAVYREGRDDETEDETEKGVLPPLAVDERVDRVKLWPEQHFTQPPPRYTEATLVKALEELGIGRPSTYAPTLATLQARYYVERVEKKLKPTELGVVVNDILVEHFPRIVDTGFTSQMEEELDEIASGERAWVPVISAFYTPFSETVQRADQVIEKVKVADQLTGEVCEKCGRPMALKMGRYGKFIACTGFPECRNAKPLLKKLGIPCPKCKAGELVERKTKRRRTFYSCSRYPECDFSVWNKPVPQPCPKCSGLMTVNGRQEATCAQCASSEPVLAHSA